MDCRGTKNEQIACVSECNQGLDHCYQLCTVVFKL
jgi:hypothetical protein